MSAAHETEAEMMRIVADDLESQGYKVIVQPGPGQLPEELKQFRPDGIAIGKKPHLVIEVTSGHESRDAEKIREAIKNNQDWKLHLVLHRSVSSVPLALETVDSIGAVLETAEKVGAVDYRAGVLLCWAALEAISRLINPKKFGRPQTPGRIVEELASAGFITPTEAVSLRKLAKSRNEFIHGQVSVEVERYEFEKFVDILQILIGYYRRNYLN